MITPHKVKVAVITPCYNSSKFIAACIKSVSLSNTFDIFEIEHIIIDDGSTDNTWDVIQKSEITNLTALQLLENKGPSFARNFAINKSDADFIFCLDSDEVIFQNSLFSLVSFTLSEKADWVYGDIIRGDNQLRYLTGKDYYGWHFQKTEDVLTAMFKNEHFFQHTCLFSRKAFERVGQYNESLHMAEDFDLFIRMLLYGYFPHYLPGPIYMHRVHGKNLSKLYTKHPEKHQETIREIYATYAEKLKLILSQDTIVSIEKAHLLWVETTSSEKTT